MARKLKILFVANKKLPLGDYRVVYGNHARDHEIFLGLPARPDGVRPSRFIPLGFEESFSAEDLLHFLSLFFCLLKKRFNLVHFYSTKLVLFGPLVCVLAGTKSMVTLTGLGRVFYDDGLIYRALRPVYLLLFRLSAMMANRVLFQNWGDLRLFSTWFPSLRDKFKYIGSASFFPEVRSKDFYSERLTVLLVSRLLNSKGIDDYLTVAGKLAGEPFDFTLVGPSSVGAEALFDRVERLGKEGIIDYKGEFHGESLNKEFKNAHIFYFPSYGEGLSRVLLEAGFSRLCPIVYNINANRDLVDEGRGHITPVRDVDKVVEILRMLNKDRARVEREAHAFQVFIAREYSFGVFAKRMDAILAEACAGR